jgi:hypothetical protein
MPDILDDPITFGKYADGMTWKQVAHRDFRYAMWLVEEADNMPEDIREALGTYLEEIDPDDEGRDSYWDYYDL